MYDGAATVRSTSILLGAMMACTQAWSDGIVPGNYPPGAFTGTRANIVAPAGTTILENGTLNYQTRRFVDGDGNASTNDTVDVLVNRTLVGHVLDFQILGADVFPAVIVPFANAPTRPEPGSEQAFQIGDVVLQPLALGWHAGSWHTTASWNVFLPTGKFKEGESNNVGKGLTSHMLSLGTTWLQETSLPWAATGTARYEYLGEQKDTGIQPGQVLTLEAGVGKEVADGFDLGLLAYATGQTTEQDGSSQNTDTTRYRAYGVGPEVTWRPAALPGSVISVRYYKEFGAINTSEGDLAVLSLGYAF